MIYRNIATENVGDVLASALDLGKQLVDRPSDLTEPAVLIHNEEPPGGETRGQPVT